MTLSLYPASIDAFPTALQDGVGTEIIAQWFNQIDDALAKIETELGVLPKGNWADVKTRLGALETLIFNFQTGASYTPVLADASKVISFNDAEGATLLVPTNAAQPFPVGTQIMVRASSTAGAISIAAATPATTTIQSRGSSFSLTGPISWATLIKVATDTWDLIGDLA